MSLDREGNCTHLQVRKAAIALHGGEVLDVWGCVDCEQRFAPTGVSVIDTVDTMRRGVIDANNTISIYRKRNILSVRIRKEQWYWSRSGKKEIWLNARTLSEIQDLIDEELGPLTKQEKKRGGVIQAFESVPPVAALEDA